jgi:hypothetical protein
MPLLTRRIIDPPRTINLKAPAPTMKKLLALSLLAGLTLNSYGGGILTDDFSYPNGGIVTNSTWVTNSGTLGTMLVDNGQLVISSSRSEDIARELSGSPYAVDGAVQNLYASFKINCTGLPSTSGGYLAHFTGTNSSGSLTGFRGRLWLSTTDPTGTAAPIGTFYVGIANSSAGNNKSGQLPTPLNTNQTYTVVIRYNVGVASATVWVNPTAESETGVTASDAVTATDLIAITHFSFRQASGVGNPVLIDDLRVGTSFGDVVGANNSPTVSGVAEQHLAANGTTGPLDFTVSDAETPAANLVITTDSSNTSLIPNTPASITLGGSGENRTITVTPLAGAQGLATITIHVSDGQLTSDTSFKVYVGKPSISAIADQMTPTNTPTAAIPFTVDDVETPNALTVTATSANEALIANSKIQLSGTGMARTIKLTPETDAAGASLITVTVDDGTLTSSSSFFVTVYPKLGGLYTNEFSYENGALPLVSASEWLGYSAQDSNDCYVVNSQLVLYPTNYMDVHAYFDNTGIQPSSGTLLFSKMKVKLDTLPRGSSGAYFTFFKDTGTSNFKARVYALTNGAAAGTYRLAIANAAASPSAVLPVDLNLGQEYTVVTRYNVATGRSTLWVDPRYETDPSATATDNSSAIAILAIAFRQDSSMGITTVDDLVIGTSFADVVPFVPAPTPIPLAINWLDGKAVLSWTDSSFKLQSATTVNGTFSDVDNATSPYTNTASAPLFFRLKY